MNAQRKYLGWYLKKYCKYIFTFFRNANESIVSLIQEMSNIKMSILIFVAGCGISMMDYLLIFQLLHVKFSMTSIPTDGSDVAVQFQYINLLLVYQFPGHFFLWGPMKSLAYDIPVKSEQSVIARIVVAAGDLSDNPLVSSPLLII